MKILKYILLAILALVALFFAFGLLKPTVSYGSEITVDKSVEEAWAVSQDKNKYDQWLDGFKSIELLEGEWMQPGSKYKVVVEPGEGQPAFEMVETLVSIVENEHVEMHFDSEFMDFEQIMTFSQANDKTTILTDSKVLAKGIVTKSMFAIMEMFGGAFTKQEQKNMDALKKLINENTDDYRPVPDVEELLMNTEG